MVVWALSFACLAIYSFPIWLIVWKTKIPAYAKALASLAAFSLTTAFILLLLVFRRWMYLRSSRYRAGRSTMENRDWVTNWLRNTPIGKVTVASEGSTTLWSQSGEGPDPETGDNNLMELPDMEPAGLDIPRPGKQGS